MLIVVHYCYRFLCTVVTDSCALLLPFFVHSPYHFLCTRDFCLQVLRLPLQPEVRHSPMSALVLAVRLPTFRGVNRKTGQNEVNNSKEAVANYSILMQPLSLSICSLYQLFHLLDEIRLLSCIFVQQVAFQQVDLQLHKPQLIKSAMIQLKLYLDMKLYCSLVVCPFH